MADIIADIQETIRKALPAHLSDQLQSVLKEGTDAKAALALARDSLTRRDAELNEVKGQLARHTLITNREDAVRKREDEVTKRETKMEINEYKVTSMGERLNDIKQIVATVFQNNRFKYQSMGTENEYANNQSHNKSTSATIETEG